MISDFEKINFEKDILTPLRQNEAYITKMAGRLMSIFTVPEFSKFFSIENFYMPQNRITEDELHTGIDITEDIQEIPDISEIRNQRNLNIITLFFEYAKERSVFTAKEFVYSLSEETINNLCEENSLPDVLVSLYAMQMLDIEAWRKTEHTSIIPNGEFELSWYLNEIDEQLTQMKKIRFEDKKDSFSFSFSNGKYTSNITMNNFITEVER